MYNLTKKTKPIQYHLNTSPGNEAKTLQNMRKIQGVLSRNSIYHPNATVHVDILVSGREVNFHLCQRILLYSYHNHQLRNGIWK